MLSIKAYELLKNKQKIAKKKYLTMHEVLYKFLFSYIFIKKIHKQIFFFNINSELIETNFVSF